MPYTACPFASTTSTGQSTRTFGGKFCTSAPPFFPDIPHHTILWKNTEREKALRKHFFLLHYYKTVATI